ncbi:MAG TPA: hypothetical protein VL551_29205 [Actinospica sp.]|nr:hypothetical protein [Actinospica sp.]
MKLRVFARSRRAIASDPVTEIDDELRRLAADLKQCQVRRERAMVARLLAVIDERLDARAVLIGPNDPRHQHGVAPAFAPEHRWGQEKEAGSRA